jgi:hypothetical protein
MLTMASLTGFSVKLSLTAGVPVNVNSRPSNATLPLASGVTVKVVLLARRVTCH